MADRLTDNDHQNTLLANFKRNDSRLFDVYLTLPLYKSGMEVRCPTHNLDGSEIKDDDVKGCGSLNVSYDGDVYDCHDCGIFFSDYAANPPHRCREDDDQSVNWIGV